MHFFSFYLLTNCAVIYGIVSYTVLSDTQKAQCYLTVRDNQCSDPSPTPVTKSTCCCATEGRGWGHPCSPCPSTTDPLYLELCPHGPGITNGGAGKPVCSLPVNLTQYCKYRVVQKAVPQFYFCDNFRKCTSILIIFSLLGQEIYDA